MLEKLGEAMARAITPSHCHHQFKALSEAIAEWESDNRPDILVPWSQGMVKGFTVKLEAAFERFFDETADFENTVVPAARSMIIWIDNLFSEYAKFKRGIAEESPSCSPSGTDGLWRAFLNVKEVFKQTAPLSRPLPISRMITDNVSLNQIATIYGWLNDDGSPDCLKVTEEIEKPGTHYNPEKWVHPALAKRQELIDKEWAVRMQTVEPRKKMFEPVASKPKPDWIPPSIDVMVLAGAPPEQIANVHGISVEEAQRRLDEACAIDPKASGSQLANV